MVRSVQSRYEIILSRPARDYQLSENENRPENIASSATEGRSLFEANVCVFNLSSEVVRPDL